MTKLITNVAELNKAIASIGARSKKLDSDIQVAALSCANHIKLHRDPRPLNALRAALGRGHRKNALDEWAFKYAGVIANVGESKKELPYVVSNDVVVDLEGGTAEPWYECKPDQDPDQVFNVAAAVRAIIAKAAKKNVEDAAFLKELSQFVAEHVEAAGDVLNEIE